MCRARDLLHAVMQPGSFLFLAGGCGWVLVLLPSGQYPLGRGCAPRTGGPFLSDQKGAKESLRGRATRRTAAALRCAWPAKRPTPKNPVYTGDGAALRWAGVLLIEPCLITNCVKNWSIFRMPFPSCAADAQRAVQCARSALIDFSCLIRCSAALWAAFDRGVGWLFSIVFCGRFSLLYLWGKSKAGPEGPAFGGLGR